MEMVENENKEQEETEKSRTQISNGMPFLLAALIQLMNGDFVFYVILSFIAMQMIRIQKLSTE